MDAVIVERYKRVHEDGAKIKRVYSREAAKVSDSELNSTIDKLNESSSDYVYELLRVPEGMEDLFDFFLGVKAYKTYASISKFKEVIDSLKDTFESIDYDIGCVLDAINEIEKDVKKLPEDDE